MTRMEEVKNKRIREACLQHALDHYLSDNIDAKKWDECNISDLQDMLSEVRIWGPFENHPLDFIVDQIENDAESIEKLVRSFL